MFMMPWIASLTRSRLPVGVILIVLMNAFVFFGLQSRDDHREQLMADYYQSSALPALELPAFEAHLVQRGETASLHTLRAMKRAGALALAEQMMEADEVFMRALREGKVITPENERFDDWRLARRQFDAMRQKLFTVNYAFDGERPSLLTAFSHQFLHASNGHIFGNMLVLILIAPAVEALLGTLPFLLIYLAGGLGALGMHLLLSSGGGMLLGASGAISAVMGAFAALLGMRRIPFFYSVIVYFDVVRAPALLALPLWLANEAVQFIWFSQTSNVAYAAHFGGLLTGAILILPLRRKALSRLLPEPEKASVAPAGSAVPGPALALQQARRQLANQRFDEARQSYLRAARDPAASADVLREAFNFVRLAPASAEYPALVAAICCARGQGELVLPLVRECFADYLKQARPGLQLKPETLLALVDRFAEGRCLAELERSMRALLASAPDHPALEAALLRTVQTLRAGGALQPAMELARLRRGASAGS